MDRYDVWVMGEAARDLEKIYAYIAESLLEPQAALRLVDEIRDKIISLEQMPYRCPERQIGIYAGKGYRQLLVRNYTVIYRVKEEEKRVIVVRVRYSASDF